MPTLVAYNTGPQEQALDMLRYRAAAQALGWKVIPGQERGDTIFPERVREADVVLIQRDFPRFFPACRRVLKEARQAGKPVLYDLDDLLIALPPNHPNRRDYEDALGGILYTILTVDQVIVSSPLLREILLPFQPRTSVWPTVLPDAIWTVKPPQLSKQESPLKIGYMGGTSHVPDLALIISPLQQVMETIDRSVELHFWGCPPPDELKSYAPVYHPGLDKYADFAAMFSATAQADIWLAPLSDGLFNRCKSPIKCWEYSAVGGVGVYSDIDPYRAVVRYGENGFLADTPEAWVTAITQLAADPALRFQMAQNAQQKLQTDGLLSVHLQAWQNLYTASYSSKSAVPPPVPLAQTMLRFSEQVQQRADARHREAVGFYQRLYDIYESWWWRAWQRFKKVIRFDFSPLPHFPIVRLSDADKWFSQDETEL
jgi:processive 1,2-diacylglycerol beta-glucosyltransferase